MTDLLAFDRLKQQLVDLGWSADRVDAELRRQMPHLAPPAEPVRYDHVLEKAEQVEIRKLAIAYGFKVYVLSQPRATKQTPGLADLWLAHKREPISLWWETKRSVGGKLSTAQEEFREDCLRTRTGYGYGDRFAFVDKLVELKLAIRGAGAYVIEPARLA